MLAVAERTSDSTDSLSNPSGEKASFLSGIALLLPAAVLVRNNIEANMITNLARWGNIIKKD